MPFQKLVLSKLNYYLELPEHEKLVNKAIRLMDPHINEIVKTDRHIRTDILHNPTHLYNLVACNIEIDVEELKALLRMVPQNPEEQLNILLRRKSVSVVMEALRKLRGQVGMRDEAALLHRKLVERFTDYPEVMKSVWMRLDVNPKFIFEDLNLDHCNVLDAPYEPLFQWLEYTRKYSAHHMGLYSDKDIAHMFFKDKAAGEVYDYIVGVAGSLSGLVKYADLRHLAIEEGFSFRYSSSDYYIDSELPSSGLSDSIEKIKELRFHPFDEIHDLTLARLLVVERPAPPDAIKYYKKVIEALLFYNSSYSVMLVLLHLPTNDGMSDVATALHRLLVDRVKKKLWAVPVAWMALALKPAEIFTILDLGAIDLEHLSLECVAQSFKFIQMYGESHPDVFSDREAVQILFVSKSAADVSAFYRRVVYDSGYATLAEKLRKALTATNSN